MNPPESTQELDSAWKALLERRGQLGSDAKLAELALGLIGEMGNGSAQRELLRELAGAWTTDWRLTLGAASLLLEQAGRRGMDEPPLREHGPAAWAAEALRRCLDALDDTDGKDPDVAGNLSAMLGNALRLCGPGKDAEAQEAFTRAIELDPERGEWWYDAGLLDKWRGRFDEGYAANEQARMRLGDQRPVLWNLAICATALGKAEEAVDHWEQLGVPARIDRSRGMPFVADLPPMLLRVLSRTPATDATSQLPDKTVGFELVWIAPLSPCHGVVQSPTFRDAPIGYGDLVLWDGAPVAAHQTSTGDAVPVFPLLEILRSGDERRWPFVALERKPGAVRSLEDALPEGVRVFIQHEQVEHHCAACEAGEPHEHVAGSGSASVSASASFVRGKLIVPFALKLEEFREAWEIAAKARAVTIALPALYEAVGDAKQAGLEHQAWRGIEGKALRQKARP
ncbi:MAG: tetratricopeptide repeat protein [Deltaproteobacteria bacterium]|nr:tetratricopeptide repeat protein [Deltaproteobacteria bacterium]